MKTVRQKYWKISRCPKIFKSNFFYDLVVQSKSKKSSTRNIFTQIYMDFIQIFYIIYQTFTNPHWTWKNWLNNRCTIIYYNLIIAMSFDVSNFNKWTKKEIVLPVCRFPHSDTHTFT